MGALHFSFLMIYFKYFSRIELPELPDSSGHSIKLQANCVFENEDKASSDLVTSHIFTRFNVN